MRPPYPRAEMERRICELVERGATLDAIERMPGFPSRQTVYRWTRGDPAFAARLDEARVQAFLQRVRLGEAVRDLVRTEGQPHRDLLNRWKAERPDFAAELAAAARLAQSLRRPRWSRYDEAVGDRIIARVAAGAPLPKVLADPALPGVTIVRRWRAEVAAFDAALKTAHLAGQRRRMRPRRRLTPELAEAIAARLAEGASLSEVAQAVGMPHRVTHYNWVRMKPEFAAMVAAACRAREELFDDLACEIAEGARGAGAAMSRARIGALRKQLGRMAMKRRDD